VLVVGIGKATRLLGHLALADKAYDATARLGVSTSTDDAEGEPVATASAAGVTDTDLRAALTALTGRITQVPPQVSAIKVAGKRSYAVARTGATVELAGREVTVSRLDLLAVRRSEDVIDVDLAVECSTGTYVRALARDLGGALDVGGHLTALRRTAVGPFDLGVARTLDQLAEHFAVLPLAAAARAAFPAIDLDEPAARAVRFGRALELPVERLSAVFAPDGEFLALYEPRDGGARPVAVFVG
jgi:tRNA pseudouridine55 synthase